MARKLHISGMGTLEHVHPRYFPSEESLLLAYSPQCSLVFGLVDTEFYRDIVSQGLGGGSVEDGEPLRHFSLTN